MQLVGIASGWAVGIRGARTVYAYVQHISIKYFCISELILGWWCGLCTTYIPKVVPKLRILQMHLQRFRRKINTNDDPDENKKVNETKSILLCYICCVQHKKFT